MSGFHATFAMGVACQQGILPLLGHLVSSPFLGLVCAQIVETRFLELAWSLFDFSTSIFLGTFSEFALYRIINIVWLLQIVNTMVFENSIWQMFRTATMPNRLRRVLQRTPSFHYEIEISLWYFYIYFELTSNTAIQSSSGLHWMWNGKDLDISVYSQ